jgi:hypothetical protein
MLFVCLSIVDFKEGFTLDLACSEDGDYPFSFQFLGDWHHVRLPDLAGLRKDGEEYFWQIATPPSLGKLMKHVEKGMPLREPNVSDEKLAEVVDEAVKVFKEYGIAFFDKVASDKGLKIQWN